MTRLAIFDLDGTLLNTIGDLAVSCNAVLACAGFSDDPGLAHFLSEERLPQRIVDLVGTGVV